MQRIISCRAVFLPESGDWGWKERMDGLVKFLAMGGYAAYVWPALGLTAVVLTGLLMVSARGARQREAELARLEAEAGRGDEG